MSMQSRRTTHGNTNRVSLCVNVGIKNDKLASKRVYAKRRYMTSVDSVKEIETHDV